MTVTQLDIQTDYYAKSNATMFPIVEKLAYYNEADGILNALIIDEQEDTGESIPTPLTTIAGQSNYPLIGHHVNWVKINYGDGFIPAQYKSEQSLITEYGNDYEDVISDWDQSSPVYWINGGEINISPAPTAAQAGAGRLKYSTELIPSDLNRTDNLTPRLVPSNFHYLHAAYAAMSWLDEDDPLWKKNERRWTSGVAAMLQTMFPIARQEEIIVGTPYDTGYNY